MQILFQMVPLMMIELFADLPGVSGLFLACLFSAALRLAAITADAQYHSAS